MKINKVFINFSDTRIAPFDKPVGDNMILNKTILQHIVDMIKKLKLERLSEEIDAGNEYYLYVSTDTFASENLLNKFINMATTACRLDINKGLFYKTTKDWYPDKDSNHFYNVAIKKYSDKLSDLPLLEINLNEKIIIPPKIHWALNGGVADELPLVDHHIYTIRHWRDLWVANWILLGCSTSKAQKNNISESSIIHKTAIIQKSVIGDNVEIGKNAIIENSILADGIKIGDNSIIKNCSVGKNSLISDTVNLKNCTICQSVAIGMGNSFQASIFGANSFIGAGVFIADLRLQKNVYVQYENKIIDSGLGFLGAAIGDGAFIGLGVYIAAGMEIPSKKMVIRKDLLKNGDNLANLENYICSDCPDYLYKR